MSSQSAVFGEGHWRGGGGTRGGKRSGKAGGHSAWVPPKIPEVDKPAGSILSTLDIRTLLVEEEAPKISDVRYVASYNWTCNEGPTIYVPGQYIDCSVKTTTDGVSPQDQLLSGILLQRMYSFDRTLVRYFGISMLPTFPAIQWNRCSDPSKTFNQDTS